MALQKVKQFNKELAKIPAKAKTLEEILTRREWYQEKKQQQAIKLVRQLQKGELVGEIDPDVKHDHVELKDLTITLSPAECGIDGSETFHEENIMGKVDQYMRELIYDLNCYSQDIHFDYARRYISEDGKTCEFSVIWDF